MFSVPFYSNGVFSRQLLRSDPKPHPDGLLSHLPNSASPHSASCPHFPAVPVILLRSPGSEYRSPSLDAVGGRRRSQELQVQGCGALEPC